MSHSSDSGSLQVEVEDAAEVNEYIEIECYEGASGSTLGAVRVDPDATVGQLKARLREKNWLPPPSTYALLVGGRVFKPDNDYCRFTQTAECRGQRFLVLNIVEGNFA